MRKATLHPPFLKKALLLEQFFITAACIGGGFDVAPHPLFLFPPQFIVYEGLYVKIRNRVMRHCRYKGSVRRTIYQ